MSDSYKAECKLLEACTAMLAVLAHAPLSVKQHLDLRAHYHDLEVAWSNYFEAKRNSSLQSDLFGGG